MCPGDLGHSRHGTVCLDAGLVHKERPWIYCNVFINKSSNLSGECRSLRLYTIGVEQLASFSNGHCDPNRSVSPICSYSHSICATTPTHLLLTYLTHAVAGGVIVQLQDISNMKNVISRVKGSQPAPILLVANKLDLDCQREVSREEGKCIAIHLRTRHAQSALPWVALLLATIAPLLIGFPLPVLLLLVPPSLACTYRSADR